VDFLTPLKTLLGSFQDCLFPKVCDYCCLPFEEGLSNILCATCFNSIRPYQDPVCSRCGAPLAPGAYAGATLLRCADCGEGEYFLDGVRAYGDYAGAVRIAHHAFKFEGMEHLGVVLAGRMAQSIPDSFTAGEAVFCPVPLSPERGRERGYNPAELLSRHLSVLKGLPVKNLLRKIKPVPPQMSLTREERFKNPVDAYEMAASIPSPSRIVLVDDVFTTGATLEECAKVLKRSGAQSVFAVVWGRTPRYF
jgi:competence protein ComFC